MNHSIQHYKPIDSLKKLYRFFTTIFFLTFFSIPSYLHAAGTCSTHLGKASLNEFFKNQSNQIYDVTDFIEVKILDGTITSAVFDNWYIRICEFNGPGNNNDTHGCSTEIPLSTFTNKTLPWLVIDGTATGSIEIGKHINFKTGFDAVLLDASKNIIDYVSVQGHSEQLSTYTGCATSQLPFDWQFSASGSSPKLIFRSPDGIGDWDYKTSAVAPPTTDATNDSGGTVGKAEWYMDEVSWSGTTNDVVDQSTNLNHGRAYNGLTTITSGKLCNAGSFDGLNDYIQIPHDNTLNGLNSLTYSAWINPTSWTNNSSNTHQIMAKSVHGSGTGRSQMGIFSERRNVSGTNVTVLVGRAETAGGRKEVFTSLPSLSTWTHIALVFNGTNLNLYINGVLAANASSTYTSSLTFSSTTLVSTTNDLMIGRKYNSNEYYFKGLIDEVLVLQPAVQGAFIQTMYNNYINGLNWDGAARSCPSSLHHIELVHDSSALTCSPEDVTVKACANADCSSLSSSATTVGLAPTGWVDGDTKTFTGSANYTLHHTTAGTVTLSTTSVSPTASNALVCKTSSGTVIDPCTMTFSDSGFIFDVATQTSCVTSSNIKISAVKADPADPEQCIPFFDGKAAPLKFWATYANPASGTKKAMLNYNAVNYLLDTATTDAGADITITFDNNGEANFTLNYADAGQLDLKAAYTGSVASSDDGLAMAGNKLYVTKPAKLYVYSDDANAACASNDGTCGAFKTAGNDANSQFNLKVRAACADTDNTVTPNFVLNNIVVSHTNTAPAIAQGNIAVTNFDMAASDSGEHIISTQSVSEVGAFTFTATSPNYLGVTGPVGTSAYIGRFYPHHFDTTVEQGCGAFTYSGQEFKVTTTAQNNWLPTPAATQNYTGTFAFETTLSNGAINPIINFYDASKTPADTNIISAVSFSNGTATKPDVIYTFPDKNTLPVNITLRANDTDTGTATGIVEGTTEVRSGRTRLENAYGSELADLSVPAQVEFYNTNGFEINTADACTTTTVTLTDIGIDPINIGDGANTGETCIWDDDGESGTDNCSALAGPATSQFLEYSPPPPPTIFAGNFNLFLRAPGATYTGDIGISLTSPTWLQYDWDGNGTHDNDPTGVASFGLYRGDDRIIYWREVF